MRFMILVKANADSEAGILPTSAELATMGTFNEGLIDAGVMLAGEGLQSSAKGARIRFDAGKTIVTDGPFAETKELLAGFWLIQAKDKAEALEWCKRIPFENGEEVELRQVFEVADFPADGVSKEHLDAEQAWRGTTQKPVTR